MNDVAIKRLEEMVKSFVEKINENPISAIDEALDVIYQINIRGEMKGFEILLAFGGPNIYLEDDRVVGYWAGDKYYSCISSDAFNQIWDYLEETNPCNV